MGYLMKWDKQLSTSFLPTTSSLMRASGSVKADAWYANGLMAQTVLRTVSIIVSAAGSVNFSSRNTLKPFGSRDSSKIGARTCRSITSSWNHQKKMIHSYNMHLIKNQLHIVFLAWTLLLFLTELLLLNMFLIFLLLNLFPLAVLSFLFHNI